MPEEMELRLAVLIDADNAPRSALGDVMAEIAVYGTPTIKRIYGDWTTPNLASWKPLLLENAITPVQLHHRQELHRLGHDHRRHGHPLRRAGGRLRAGVQ